MKKIVKIILMALVFYSMIGCSATSKFMKKVPADSVKASGNNAKVIFYRTNAGDASTILTSDGKYIGEGIAKSQFAVTLPAGNYTFISWSETTPTMKANLKAGKTYYVRVVVTMGAWAARSHLFPIKPGTEAWTLMQKDIRNCAYYAVDRDGGQKNLIDSRKPGDVKSVIAKGEKRFSEYSDKEQEERTLNLQDGI